MKYVPRKLSWCSGACGQGVRGFSMVINVSKYEHRGKSALKIPAALRLTAPSDKAAEDSRTPKPGGVSCAHEHALASWSAAVLCRFAATPSVAFEVGQTSR